MMSLTHHLEYQQALRGLEHDVVQDCDENKHAPRPLGRNKDGCQGISSHTPSATVWRQHREGFPAATRRG